MKYFIIAVVTLGLSMVFLFNPSYSFAGGCCYFSFNSIDGIAGQRDAQIFASFTNPLDPYEDEKKTKLKALTGKRIAIHIKAPLKDQSCWMTIENPDPAGVVAARCSSSIPGTIQVYFTSPDMSSEENSYMSSVTKSIRFEVNPNASQPPATPTLAIPTSTTALQSETKTVTPSLEEDSDKTEQNAKELQNRVNELEKQVKEQEKKVSFLQSLVEKLMSLFGGFFGGK